MTKFHEMMLERSRCLHEKTVYDEVVNFLAQFVEDEVHKPDRSMSTGDLGPVPQEIIRQVMERVQQDNIDALNGRILNIESMRVEVPHDKEQKAAVEQGSAKGGSAKSNGKARSIKITQQGGRGSAGNQRKVAGSRVSAKPDVEEPTGAGEE